MVFQMYTVPTLKFACESLLITHSQLTEIECLWELYHKKKCLKCTNETSAILLQILFETYNFEKLKFVAKWHISDNAAIKWTKSF